MGGLSKITNDMSDIEKGLSTEEAKRRLSEYGYNEVPEKKTHFLVRLAKCFWGIVPWMLEELQHSLHGFWASIRT